MNYKLLIWILFSILAIWKIKILANEYSGLNRVEKIIKEKNKEMGERIVFLGKAVMRVNEVTVPYIRNSSLHKRFLVLDAYPDLPAILEILRLDSIYLRELYPWNNDYSVRASRFSLSQEYWYLDSRISKLSEYTIGIGTHCEMYFIWTLISDLFQRNEYYVVTNTFDHILQRSSKFVVTCNGVTKEFNGESCFDLPYSDTIIVKSVTRKINTVNFEIDEKIRLDTFFTAELMND